MGIHLLLLAKTTVLYWFKFTPLLWPFNLYLPVSRRVSKMCDTLSAASSLLMFRLERIAAEGLNANGTGLHRIERALRLFWQDMLGGPPHFPHNALDGVGLGVLHHGFS